MNLVYYILTVFIIVLVIAILNPRNQNKEFESYKVDCYRKGGALLNTYSDLGYRTFGCYDIKEVK